MDVEQVAMEIIANAGAGKSKVYQALEVGIDGDLAQARDLISSAQEDVNRSHEVWHQVLTAFAEGEGPEPNLLIMHAMDIMIAAETELELARHVLRLAERRAAV
ncbi:MAG: PTS lactose/cellobiose transporter subunit IIA [Symbiobacteriia bacterium]